MERNPQFASYVYRAEVFRVIDGDTYHMTIDLGFRVSVTLPIRLRGWNCAELNTQMGQKARDAVIEIFDNATDILVVSYHDRMSFARWMADVYVDGQSLGELLHVAGLAEVMNR
jgi:endonuclease YncB( thermonuclease family)